MSHVKNIAIIGAGGQIGGVLASALLGQGKHTLTAITRPDSTSAIPAGIHSTKKASYDDHAALVEALRGQDVLIITLNALAPKDSSTKLIDAAADAGVSWIVPNGYGLDPAQEQLGADVLIGPAQLEVRRYIERVSAERTGGKLAWIGICCGFWYEFSLAGTEARYGFDFPARKVTFFDDGRTTITTTTWLQVGRAVAKLLALPLDAGADNEVSLGRFRNENVHISSYQLSQRDMFASVLRVTGTQESDWSVSHEDVKARYARGKKMYEEGTFVGFGILLYSRVFFPDDPGNFGDKLDNEVLGLPKEDLDEATGRAVKMAMEAKEFGTRV